MKYEKKFLNQYSIDEIRKLGFPYFEFDKREYINLFKKLKSVNYNDIIDDINNEILFYKFSLFHKLSSVFFPQMFEVEVNGNMKTPLYTFENHLEEVIKKTFKLSGKNATVSKFRDMLKLFEGTQSVGNFNPSTAKAIYDKWGNFGKVLDTSSGWGGRLVGFLASNCKEYVGVDVNSSLFEGYQKIIENYNINKKKVIIVQQGSETLLDYTNVKIGNKNFKFEKNYFDFAFTSPPYYSKELYSKDKEQSYIKFKDYDNWLENFLIKTLRNTEILLKPGAYYGINIMGVKINNNFFDIIDDVIKKYKTPIKIYKMILNKHTLSGKIKKENKNKNKNEVFLLFKKDGELEDNNIFKKLFLV